jgi:hypothetical protein
MAWYFKQKQLYHPLFHICHWLIQPGSATSPTCCGWAKTEAFSLQARSFDRPYQNRVLLKSLLQILTVVFPPIVVQVISHHFKHNHVIASDVFFVILP